MSDPDPPTTREAQTLLAMARGYRSSQLVYVAAKLKIADLLADGPRTCEEMAASLGASSDALCRVMRGLSLHGIFEWREDGRFALTELSKPLLSAAAGSVRAGVMYWGEEQYRAWGDLLSTVMTGEAAFVRLYGDPFAYYDRHPETGSAFDSFMTASSRQVAIGILSNYEIPDSGMVVDVGGGEGVLLAAILISRPRLRGALLERPTVIEKARRLLADEGVIDRCVLEAGDFRQAVPRGGDLYILRNVLHDWDDRGALQILSAVRQAMTRNARLLVIQRAVPSASLPTPAMRSLIESDLMQLVYSGGRERTEAEYRDLLTSAGLELTLTMQGRGLTWLMEARPGSIARPPDDSGAKGIASS